MVSPSPEYVSSARLVDRRAPRRTHRSAPRSYACHRAARTAASSANTRKSRSPNDRSASARSKRYATLLPLGPCARRIVAAMSSSRSSPASHTLSRRSDVHVRAREGVVLERDLDRGALNQYRDGRRSFLCSRSWFVWISTALIRLGIFDARRGRGIVPSALAVIERDPRGVRLAIEPERRHHPEQHAIATVVQRGRSSLRKAPNKRRVRRLHLCDRCLETRSSTIRSGSSRTRCCRASRSTRDSTKSSNDRGSSRWTSASRCSKGPSRDAKTRGFVGSTRRVRGFQPAPSAPSDWPSGCARSESIPSDRVNVWGTPSTNVIASPRGARRAHATSAFALRQVARALRPSRTQCAARSCRSEGGNKAMTDRGANGCPVLVRPPLDVLSPTTT